MGVTPKSTVATFSNGVVIPELVYICFQMTFACITPALIVGAFAERMKFSALLLFIALWVTFVYFPIAHMVWYWAGPDALADAAKKVAEAAAAAKAEAEKALAAVQADAGLAFQWGAIDFAGGTVVHINAGIAGLVGALMLGQRVGFRQEPMPPHSVTLTCVGAALLWVGWFGFNAGSTLEATGSAALAMTNTFVATAAAACRWMIFEFIFKWKMSLLGLCSGVVAGLVAVTPAAGFAGPMGAAVARRRRRRDLPVLLHGHQGAVQVRRQPRRVRHPLHRRHRRRAGTGLLVSPEYGGTGILDYVVKPGRRVGRRVRPRRAADRAAQGRALTLGWSGIGSVIILAIVKLTIGTRVSPEEEQQGLDLTQHGERGYVYEH